MGLTIFIATITIGVIAIAFYFVRQENKEKTPQY